MTAAEDNPGRFRVIQGGEPGLDRFLDAADQLQNPQPVDQQAVSNLVMDSNSGEMLEGTLTESLRLGRMHPDAEEAIKRDARAIIASIRDPEVELTPTLVERRERFLRQVAPIISLTDNSTMGDKTDGDSM